MPEVARVAEADGLAVLDDVGDDEDFRLPLQLELVQHVDLQRAEAAAERDLLRGRDALVAEDQHVVVQVRAMDAAEVGLVQWLVQVQPDDLGGEAAGDRPDLDALEPHLVGVLLENCGTHGGPHAKTAQG